MAGAHLLLVYYGGPAYDQNLGRANTMLYSPRKEFLLYFLTEEQEFSNAVGHIFSTNLFSIFKREEDVLVTIMKTSSCVLFTSK